MLEVGDGQNSCGGAPLVPPKICHHASDPSCKKWVELGPELSKKMGLTASSMLDAWKPLHEHVLNDDEGIRRTTEWPVWGSFPCCGGDTSTCACNRDVPPKKGQAPRAKPKSGPRVTYLKE